MSNSFTKIDPLISLFQAALFTGIISVSAQISVPFFTFVPFTLQTLAVGIAATYLGPIYGLISVSLYLFLGFVIGLPVFSNFTGGLAKLTTPTAGYLFAFLISVLVIGIIVKLFKQPSLRKLLPLGIQVANILGATITLIIGSLWLKYSLDISFTKALSLGFYPFILIEMIKSIIAGQIGYLLYRFKPKKNIV